MNTKNKTGVGLYFTLKIDTALPIIIIIRIVELLEAVKSVLIFDLGFLCGQILRFFGMVCRVSTIATGD